MVEKIGGPDRDRIDDLFHAIDPTLSFSTTYKTPVASKVLVSIKTPENRRIAKRIALLNEKPQGIGKDCS
jgi:hypothetical protein